MAKGKKKIDDSQQKDLDPRILLIAERLKEIRVKAGYTNYEDFAYESEINRMQYWRLEKGKNMRLDSLFRILDAHGMKLKDFFASIDI